MIHQELLEFTPALTLPPGFARPGQQTDGVEYRSSSSARALLRRTAPDLSHFDRRNAWPLEPYRGSESGSLLDAAKTRSGRRRVLVDSALPATLRRRLSRCAHPGLSITLGERFEPYPSAEERFTITRTLLEILEEARDLEIEVKTGSPLVLRDLDLLRRLDLKHTVTVTVPIATLDRKLAVRLEGNAAEPSKRLEIVRALALDGIAVVVACGPLLPGINSSADELSPLFAAVRRAGALDVLGDARPTEPKYRRSIAGWLDEHAPESAAAVLRALTSGGSKTLLGTLERLRLTHGFPKLRAGRG